VVEKVQPFFIARMSIVLTWLQAEQERQAAVIRAEGEAEAAATISKALDKAGDAFVAFRKIETSKAIAQSLANSQNVTYIPSNGNVLLNLPTQR
jgi:prohibitin 1